MDKNLAPIKSRIVEFLDFQKIKKTEFLTNVGIAQSSLRGKAGESEIGGEAIAKILSKYPEINAEWLITGIGEMFKEEQEVEVKQIFQSKAIEKKHEQQIVNLYSFEASAGLKELFDNKGDNILDTIMIPNLPRCDGAIHIVGDSMMPILKSGDIILYKEVTPRIDSIIFGEMYLVSVVMEEGIYLTVVKYIRRSKKNGYITLASENPLHEDTEVDFRRVNAMALVQASIRINSMM